jgi:histone H3/H4
MIIPTSLKIMNPISGEYPMAEVLVVTSKIKKLIKEKSGLSTSASAIDAISKIVEKEILTAIERARADGRKTVMDRDF